MDLRKAFTLIEILVVITIIIIIFVISIPVYQGFVESGKCNTYKAQHKTAVDSASNTFTMCRLNKETLLSSPPGFTCRGNSNMSVVSSGSNQNCVKKWNCQFSNNISPSAGLMDVNIFYDLHAKFGTFPNSDSFVRNDQWQNFLKPGYPSKPGIINVRQKGNNLHIATFLGEGCKEGDYINSGGAYMIDEIVWP